jgi:hypothetical protein
MSDPASTHPSRDERLAAKLRENLRRRKAQARAINDAIDEAIDGAINSEPGESGLPKPGGAG